jgi:hypothetical protein
MEAMGAFIGFATSSIGRRRLREPSVKSLSLPGL